MRDLRNIEIRNMKWPHRHSSVSKGRFLGEDEFGRWVGYTKGDPWQSADGARTGTFLSSFVLVVPRSPYWTACFNADDPVVDVDIVLPVSWVERGVEPFGSVGHAWLSRFLVNVDRTSHRF